MMLPPGGNGRSAKQPALSLTQSREPNLHIKPEATRSPVVVVRPVRMKTPAADAEGPTVGAKCRGIVTAYAIGWLIEVVPCGLTAVSGCGYGHERHGDVPRFEDLRWR